MPDSLLLRLKRCWFDAIAAGYKTDEYRRATEYWRKRIENHSYTSILFKNGYGNERPSMVVDYRGWSQQEIDSQLYYVLHLGTVRDLLNYCLPAQRPSPQRCEPIRLDPSRLVYNPELKLWMPLHRFPLVSTECTIPVSQVKMTMIQPAAAAPAAAAPAAAAPAAAAPAAVPVESVIEIYEEPVPVVQTLPQPEAEGSEGSEGEPGERLPIGVRTETAIPVAVGEVRHLL